MTLKTTSAIRHHMSPMPHSIGSTQKLSVAHRMMRQHDLRHLPVLDAGKLAGVVSERDLYFVETLRDVSPDQTDVREAMSQDAYTVDPEAPLDDVARTMAERKLGCAVVIDHGKVVGIFTTTDALWLFSDLLRTGAPGNAHDVR